MRFIVPAFVLLFSFVACSSNGAPTLTPSDSSSSMRPNATATVVVSIVVPTSGAANGIYGYIPKASKSLVVLFNSKRTGEDTFANIDLSSTRAKECKGSSPISCTYRVHLATGIYAVEVSTYSGYLQSGLPSGSQVAGGKTRVRLTAGSTLKLHVNMFKAPG